MDTDGNNPQTTLDAVNTWCEHAFAVKKQIDILKDEVDQLNATLTETQTKILIVLAENNLDRYSSPFGNVSVAEKLSVKTPKLPEDKAAFFDYLKGKGIFEDLVSVNSQTLNAFYKEELEAAKASGVTEENFKIPGLTEVKPYQQLQMRK